MTGRVGRLAITGRAVAALIALAAVGLAAGIAAQSPPSVRSINELRRSSFTWNPAEIEFGFANWDRVFPGREVRRGARVRELPAGPPIVALSSGTAGGDELERFITEQKVAGLIVLSEGRVRLERYALGYSAAGRWTSQSVAKSMTSTLVGAAISDGFIASLDDPVTKYIAGLKDSSYEGVTIRHLITMTSGVRWTEAYTDPQSDIARFYSEPVTPGLDATVSYMRKLPREAPPGTKWVYKTGETHLLGVLVSSATHQPIADYLSAKIWAPYGMEQSAWWTLDRTISNGRGAACRRRCATTHDSGNSCSRGRASTGDRSCPPAGSTRRRGSSPARCTAIGTTVISGGSGPTAPSTRSASTDRTFISIRCAGWSSRSTARGRSRPIRLDRLRGRGC
jgi:hypothetical protein